MSDDIRRAFDEMLATPHPALRAAVRARLEAAAERRAAGTASRLAKLGVVTVILVLGALSFSVVNSSTNRGLQHPGQNPVLASPGPSPSATPFEIPSDTSSIECDWTVATNMLTVTFSSVTVPPPLAPIRGSLTLTDRLGDHTVALAPDTGQTLYQMSIQVSPPVTSVGANLESTNNSIDSVGCFPGYVKAHGGSF